jgi:hypothetical protein
VAAPRGERPAGLCADCGAPHDERQLYCLDCGRRLAPRSPQLVALLRRVRQVPAVGKSGAPGAPGPLPASAVKTADAASRSDRLSPRVLLGGLSGMSLPSPRVSTLLVLAFAGFGVLLGSLAGSPVNDTLAAQVRQPVKLLLPATSTSGEQPQASSSEAPAVQPEPTPAPPAAVAEEAPAVPSSPAKAPAAAKEEREKPPGASEPSGAKAPAKLPAIDHVFVVMLADEPYAATFGPDSAAPYLAHTLERRGTLLARYYAVAHGQLANGIALVSGQGPTAGTTADCPAYVDVAPATIAADEQVAGDGCVFPDQTPTLAGELEVKHRTWRAYVQGIGEGAGGPPACAHPALGQPDPTLATPPGTSGAYATFRNPFVYFSGLVESPSCATDDVGLGSLDADLASAGRTPSLSYIVPDRCHDGSPGPCPGGGAGGLPAADALLAQIVPKILASRAYKQGGLLVITTDEAPSTGELADSSSCCGQPRYPNLPSPTGVAAALPPEGGGQVGALLLSPFVKARTISQQPYNHYSLLRTIEDLFSLKHLGYAAAPHAESLPPALFGEKPAG